jgi:hypothetical protein
MLQKDTQDHSGKMIGEKLANIYIPTYQELDYSKDDPDQASDIK